jgi:hypothetical protein
MISRNIAVVDVHPEHWNHLIRGPGRKPGGRPKKTHRRSGWLLLVHEDGLVSHAVLRGWPRPDLVGTPVDDLKALRRRHNARMAVCLEKGCLRRAMRAAESSLSYDMDYAEQVLTYVSAFRAERGSGLVADPPLPSWPVPPFGALQFVFDRLWPDGTSLVFYVVDEERQEIFTSLILRKRQGDIDLLTTDLHLASRGLQASSWKTDRERLIAWIGERVAPVHLAWFSSLQAWRNVKNSRPGSGAFRRLRASGDLIVNPFPHRLAIPTWVAGLVASVVGHAKN